MAALLPVRSRMSAGCCVLPGCRSRKTLHVPEHVGEPFRVSNCECHEDGREAKSVRSGHDVSEADKPHRNPPTLTDSLEPAIQARDRLGERIVAATVRPGRCLGGCRPPKKPPRQRGYGAAAGERACREGRSYQCHANNLQPPDAKWLRGGMWPSKALTSTPPIGAVDLKSVPASRRRRRP